MFDINTPNIYIVGFQKCASSTLFEVLLMHPDVSGTTPKETFFLVDDNYDHFDPDKNIINNDCSWDTYIRANSQSVVESSVCNFYQQRALESIESDKDSKVIFILRDPVERFISVYKYLIGKINGIPANTSLDDFFDQCNEGKFDRHILKYAIEHGKYHKYIELWKNALGSDRIHIIGMKPFLHKPDETLSSLFAFLSLPTCTIQSIPHKNKSKTYTYPFVHKKLVSVFGGSLFSNQLTKSIYSMLFMKPVDKSKLQFKSRALLREIYEKEYNEYSCFF